MLDFNSQSSGLSDRINWFIDQAVLKTRDEEGSRNYLGASVVGRPCERQIQFMYVNQPRDAGKGFGPAILRVFQRGHKCEDMAIGWLRNAGFLVLDRDPATNEQFGFTALDGKFAGHLDGIIPYWRNKDYDCPIELPVLWEHKCFKDKRWKAAAKSKIRKEHPDYYAQAQIYMMMFHLPRCWFMITNADTMQIHHEIFPYDEAVAKSYFERAERILRACEMRELLPRLHPDRSYFDCKYCDWADFCWQI